MQHAALAVAILFFIAGIAGTILPALPGAILIYAGMLLYGFMTGFARLGATFFVLEGLALVFTFFIDYLSAMVGTKKFGGSRYAAWAAAAGAIIGAFSLGPLGIFVGAFLGALLAEILLKRDFSHALKAGTGTLLGVIGGTLLKLAVEIAMIAWFFMSIK